MQLSAFFHFLPFLCGIELVVWVRPSQRQQSADMDRVIAFASELGPSQLSFPDAPMGAGLGALLTTRS
jgi:hypothetical protein